MNIQRPDVEHVIMRPCGWGKTLYWVWSLKIQCISCLFPAQLSGLCLAENVTAVVAWILSLPMFSCGLSVVIKLTLGSALLTLMWGSTWWGESGLGLEKKWSFKSPGLSPPDVRGVLQACFGWIEQLTGWLSCMLLTERKKCSFSGLCQAKEANNQTAVMLFSEAQTLQPDYLFKTWPCSTGCT